MRSQAMQDWMDAFRDQRKARARQPPPTLAERRAAFAPGDRPHPVPGDVQVTGVTAGRVPAYWLDAPRVDAGRVLLFLHGGGGQLGSLSDSERLAAAAATGVEVTVQIAEGLPHVYQLMAGTPEAAEATGQIGTFLRARVP